MNEEKKTTGQTNNQQRTGSLQQEENRTREKTKADLRKTIRAIRQGHATGGYCETTTLHGEEKKLHAILSTELEEATKNRDIEAAKRIETELRGISWKPKLVVAHDQ